MHSEEESRAGLGSGFPGLRRNGTRVVRLLYPQAGIWPQSQGCVAPVGVGGRLTSQSSGSGCPGRPLCRGRGL